MQAPSMTPTASNAETLQQVPSEKSHAKDVQQGTDASATKTGKGLKCVGASSLDAKATTAERSTDVSLDSAATLVSASG